MKIETKLNDGDAIFFINPHTSKVIQSVVRGFKIELLNGIISTTYLCNNSEDERVSIKVQEDVAFKTKKDLLNSL